MTAAFGGNAATVNQSNLTWITGCLLKAFHLQIFKHKTALGLLANFIIAFSKTVWEKNYNIHISKFIKDQKWDLLMERFQFELAFQCLSNNSISLFHFNKL
jgi:hypothetical protein